MTMQDRKTRVERLNTDPLFYYRTLRDSVEQLDSLKVAFQYLLAAHEMSMDPGVKARYETDKQQERAQQLRQAHLMTDEAAQQLRKTHLTGDEVVQVTKATANPTLGEVTDYVADRVAKAVGEQTIDLRQLTMPAQASLTDLRSDLVSPGIQNPEVMKQYRTQGNASQMPQDVEEQPAVQPPRQPTEYEKAQFGGNGLTDQAPGFKGSLNVKGGFTIPGVKVQESPDSPLTALSSKALLEAMRMGARKKVAEEVNRILKSKGIHFNDSELVDYMENRLTADELQGVANRVVTSTEEIVEDEEQFALTQSGQTLKMIYGKGGLLSKILHPSMHRNGQGVIDQADGEIHCTDFSELGPDGRRHVLRFHNPFSTTALVGEIKSGLYEIEPGMYGLMVVLPKRNEDRPWKYYAWLPQYKNDAPVPTIYVTRNASEGFISIDCWSAEDLSDITNRLVHYLAKWTALVNGNVQTDATRDAAEKTAEPARKMSVYATAARPKGSMEHPEDTAAGKLQATVYERNGLLDQLLGSDLHLTGHGPMNAIASFLNDSYLSTPFAAVPVGFKFDRDAETGVYETSSGMAGLLLRADLNYVFWMPLHVDPLQKFPSIYYSSRDNKVFYDVNTSLYTWELGQMLVTSLERWIKNL